MKKLFFILGLTFTLSSLHAQGVNEGLKLIETENYSKAKELFKTLYKQDPSAANSYYLGNAYFHSGVLDSAGIYFNEGLKKDLKYALNYVGVGKVLYPKNTADAKKKFEEALSLSKSKDVVVLNAIAGFYISTDALEVPQAFTLLDMAAKQDPKNAEVLILKGDGYWKIRDGSKAVQSYEEALKLNPNNTKTLLALGNSYKRVTNYDRAIENYTKIISLDPAYAPAYKEMGDSYNKKKNTEKATESYQNYFNNGGEDANTAIYYSTILIGKGDYKKALQILKPYENKEFKEPVYNRMLGVSYYETGDFDKSFSNMKKVMEKGEGSKLLPVDYDYYGRLYAKKENDSLAIINLEKSVQMDSSRSVAMSELGNAYLRSKKYDKTAQVLQYKVDKKNASIMDAYNLGRAYLFSKEYSKADTAFGSVVKAAPAYAPAYFQKGNAKAGLDPTSEKGLAKPYFEKFIELTKSDEANNKKEIVRAYEYLGYYYMITKNKLKAKDAYTAIKKIDPANKNADEAMKLVNTMK